jgi:hypothetical protein
VTALERDAARLEGERATLVVSIAQARGKIPETELQVLQIDQDLRSEVGKDLAEIRGKLAELTETRVGAENNCAGSKSARPRTGSSTRWRCAPSLRGLKLVPGMLVKSFLQTGERTVLSYLTKPLQDQIAKAWREK